MKSELQPRPSTHQRSAAMNAVAQEGTHKDIPRPHDAVAVLQLAISFQFLFLNLGLTKRLTHRVPPRAMLLKHALAVMALSPPAFLRPVRLVRRSSHIGSRDP